MCLTKINNLKAICVINVGPVWRLFWSFNLIFFPCLFSWGSAAIRLWWNLIFLLWGRGVTNIPADALSFHPSSVFTLSDCHSSGRCLKDEQMLNPATIPSLHMLTTQFFPHLCPTTKKQTLFLENQKCCALQPCLHPVRLYCCHPIHMQYSISVVCNPIIIVVSTANSGGQLNGQLFISLGLNENSLFFKPWGINRWLIVSMNNSTQLLTLCTMWPHSFSLVKRH